MASVRTGPTPTPEEFFRRCNEKPVEEIERLWSSTRPVDNGALRGNCVIQANVLIVLIRDDYRSSVRHIPRYVLEAFLDEMKERYGEEPPEFAGGIGYLSMFSGHLMTLGIQRLYEVAGDYRSE